MSGRAKRVVVTGLGLVSPLGLDRAEFTEGVVSGRSGLRRIQGFNTTNFRTSFGGEVSGLNVEDHLSAKELETLADPNLRFALIAARQALAAAGLNWSREEPPSREVGLVVGTCNGGLKVAEEQYAIIHGLRPGRFDRRMALLIRYHTSGKSLSFNLGIRGPTWVLTTACSSSTAALGVALELISQGLVHTVLTGGSDALCLSTMAGFDGLKATSDGRTAPFSRPSGLNLGEGAAFWVLESAERAAARGAKVEAELASYAFTADAHHPTAPDPRGDGAFRTMRTALARAGSSPAELGCINAHGTGTEANDRTESKAIARLLEGQDVGVYSFKSQVGHCLGAAGILEATAGLVAMQAGYIPATINFSEPRPGCNLDYVPNHPRPAQYSSFISCNYAFGGNNAAVVIRQFEVDKPPAAGPDPEVRNGITGCGAITPFGLGVEPLLQALREKRRALTAIDARVTVPTRSKLGGLVPAFTAREVDRRLDLGSMNQISRYATAAARLTLSHAGLRVGPREGLDTGIVNGVYVGPSETEYMQAVIPSQGADTDIVSFSQIVANATAGWVSNSLLLKGYSATVSQGADAGLFALLLSALAIRSRSASRLLAGAADELYERYFRNYDELGLLHQGQDEAEYGLRLDEPDRRVLGEGAAYLLLEEREAAQAREALIAAELVGWGMTTDLEGFQEPNLDPTNLTQALHNALAMAGWSAGEVGLVLWSPQGNRGDRKILQALSTALGPRADQVPLVTTVFNTGLAEATCGTITLAAVLGAWNANEPLWPQITGVPDIDQRPLPEGRVPFLVVASSDLGFNLALAFSPSRGKG